MLTSMKNNAMVMLYFHNCNIYRERNLLLNFSVFSCFYFATHRDYGKKNPAFWYKA